IGLFFKRNRQLFIGLLGLTWVYFTLWFFAISHQRRFNFFGLILLMILAGIAAGQLINRYLPKIKSAILVILIILMVGAGGGVIFSKKNNYFWQVKKTDLLYVMGIYGEQDFYDHRDLGSIYQISNYLNNHYQQTKFFNIWKSVSFFLKNDNTFIAPDALLEAGRFSPDQLKQYLIDNKINYAIEDGPQKARDYFEATTFKGDFASDYYKFLIMSEALTESVKKIGQVIYEQAGVKIYQFDFKS
ncbi:MAG: hypothetical protein NTV81_02125, partial [Candidatus Komeilibacteria bacterium]|nr:hypothetical protein [Candidatus Komeilibacteria bacterium]